jgi:hypothetical protein
MSPDKKPLPHRVQIQTILTLERVCCQPSPPLQRLKLRRIASARAMRRFGSLASRKAGSRKSYRIGAPSFSGGCSPGDNRANGESSVISTGHVAPERVGEDKRVVRGFVVPQSCFIVTGQEFFVLRNLRVMNFWLDSSGN